ncbi:hypothetical protein [Dyadobacter sp. CY326]|uniref:hypothetical protein n=1 Tax=Dyadobacter sp. CY326 TaxID=2907300 RepID=UPI001F178226|nr:hypothetical protein [Dyadobacter sp. CY326]MCE7064025.1 hypothetical protein [Dyadobacter sp. CY326]
MEKRLVLESHLEPCYPFFGNNGEVVFYNVKENKAFRLENLEFKQGGEVVYPELITFGVGTLKYAIYWWGKPSAFEEVFDEHHQWYENKMSELQKKYREIKESKFKESGVFFEKKGMISYPNINDADFLQFLIRKNPPSLQIKLEGIEVKSIGAQLLKSLTIIFSDTFFGESLNLKMFAEYSIYKENQFNEMLKDMEVEQKPPMSAEPKRKAQAKHYVLSYLFECHATGEVPINFGNKKDLERIGNRKMGAGKGNTFYKNYNIVANVDLNSERKLIDLAGVDWRTIILSISTNPEEVEKYLKVKGL